MKTYVKPSGAEVEVNPNSYDLAESLGWKEKEAKPEIKAEPKRETLTLRKGK